MEARNSRPPFYAVNFCFSRPLWILVVVVPAAMIILQVPMSTVVASLKLLVGAIVLPV